MVRGRKIMTQTGRDSLKEKRNGENNNNQQNKREGPYEGWKGDCSKNW